MPPTSRTPADLTIYPRNIKFAVDGAKAHWWANGDPIATALFNAFSVTFPDGETHFIESVVRYKNDVSEPLRSQITAFVRQEAAHTREHIAFNDAVAQGGYDISRILARTKARTDLARTKPPQVQLAATAALEHFTALFAHEILSNPAVTKGMPEDLARLWRWHSIEEIEHKAVAFDTFLAATAKLPARRRYVLRVTVMALVTMFFTRSMITNVADLLRQDGFEPRQLRWRALSYLFGRPGVLRRILPAYLDYFRPGFHPWSHDDRALIEGADADIQANGAGLAPA